MKGTFDVLGLAKHLINNGLGSIEKKTSLPLVETMGPVVHHYAEQAMKQVGIANVVNLGVVEVGFISLALAGIDKQRKLKEQANGNQQQGNG